MCRAVFALFAVLVLVSCTGVRPIPAPPEGRHLEAQIPGFPDVRFWGDVPPETMASETALVARQIRARVAAEGKRPNGGRGDLLVLSGGGADGAYGAGLLNGWTARGDRPEFGLVTGISTGALIAPFAFVGSEFDSELKNFFTETQTSDVFTLVIVKALAGEALGLADTEGFTQAVDKGLTPDLISRIAEEHAKGRRLWVGTTNLDAQRPVVWDIGEIASRETPGKRELIRDVLIASASIPGAFPPQLIEVEVDGRRYSEMHVDGGVSRQLFLYPIGFDMDRLRQRLGTALRPGTIYVIRNTQLEPSFTEVEAGILEITSRSMSTLIKYSGVADVEIIRAQAIRDGFGLKLTAVPPDFDLDRQEFFDPSYMRALYNVGYSRILDRDPWRTEIPPKP